MPSIFGPYSSSDKTIQVPPNGLEGQWEMGNYQQIAQINQTLSIEADITERYQTVKNGPVRYRGNVFLKSILPPNMTPLPPLSVVIVSDKQTFIAEGGVLVPGPPAQ